MDNQGHGHVKPRKDGQIMRCGGPGFCTACSVEASHELTRLREELDEARRHAKVLAKEFYGLDLGSSDELSNALDYTGRLP